MDAGERRQSSLAALELTFRGRRTLLPDTETALNKEVPESGQS